MPITRKGKLRDYRDKISQGKPLKATQRKSMIKNINAEIKKRPDGKIELKGIKGKNVLQELLKELTT